MAKLSLEEFAKTLPRKGRVCWVCQIPERAEIEAQRIKSDAIRGKTGYMHDGISSRAIVRWLVEVRGYSPEEATATKLKAHFDREHYKPEKANGKAKG